MVAIDFGDDARAQSVADALAAVGYVSHHVAGNRGLLGDQDRAAWIDVDLTGVDFSKIADDADLHKTDWSAIRGKLSGYDNTIRLITGSVGDEGLQIAGQLRRATGVGSVLMLDDMLHLDPQWGWPLRILNPKGSRTSQVAGRMRDYDPSWMSNLVDFIEIDPDSDAETLSPSYDFAFVNDETDLEVLESLRGVQINALVLGGIGPDAPQWERVRVAARQLGTAAILVSGVEDPDRQAYWFEHLLREVSRNSPLEVAVSRISDSSFVVAGAVSPSPMENVRRRMRTAFARESERQGLHPVFRLDDPTTPDVLAEDADARLFDQKLSGATSLRDLRKTNSLGVDLLPEPPTPRALLADVRRGGEPAREAFRAGAAHEVLIWVGRVDEGGLVARALGGEIAPIDSADLKEGVRCEIVVWDSRGSLQRRVVRIGRARTSETAEFLVAVDADVPDYALSVALLLNGRVVQMGVIRGPVTKTGGRARRAGGGLIEFVVGPQLADLTSLKDSVDIGGVVTMLEQETMVHELLPSSPHPQGEPVEEVQRSFNSIQLDRFGNHFEQSLAVLVSAQSDAKSSGWLRSEAGAALFAQLAQSGFSAYRAIVDDFASTDPARLRALTDSSLVHLVVFDATESRLAVELLYDREKPDDGAAWCEGFDEALETGVCPSCKPWNPDAVGDGPTPVCPAGFWGVRKQVERIAYTSSMAEAPATLAVRCAVDGEPISGLGNLRVGVSDRVDKALIGDRSPTDLMQDLIQAAGLGRADLIKDWKTWVAEIELASPQLLILLTHSEGKNLELGNHDVVDSDRIKTSYVRAPFSQSPAGPIVLLLGCETSTTRELSSFVQTFRARGASVVIGTSGTTLGRFAAPIAGELLAVLNDPDGPLTVGEALTVVRRRTMKKGWVTGLLMTSFTNASYRLAR